MLLDEAPTLLPDNFAPAEDIRRSTIEILRVAAMKGFLRLIASNAPVTFESPEIEDAQLACQT